jgi:hypothetical protein
VSPESTQSGGNQSLGMCRQLTRGEAFACPALISRHQDKIDGMIRILEFSLIQGVNDEIE